MAQRLDNRGWLEGGTRLSDAQVIALRACAAGPVYRDRTAYKAGEISIRPGTIAGLERMLLVKVEPSGCCGKAVITGGGRALLAKINAAEAG